MDRPPRTPGGIAFSLVIPAFDEARRLPGFLASAVAHLEQRHPGAFEIVVVDDGSRDATAAVAAETPGPVRVLRLPCNQGKGAAVRAGMLAARGALRLFADADGATPIWEERRLTAAIGAGHDVAIGSRAAPGGMRVWSWGWVRGDGTSAALPTYAEVPVVWRVRPHRHWPGRLFAWLVMAIVGIPFCDTQCGFKLFRAAAAEAIFPLVQCDRYAFDVEVLALARQLGLRTAEVAVQWHEVPGSKVRLVRDALQMVGELGPIRRRSALAVATVSDTEQEREQVARKAG